MFAESFDYDEVDWSKIFRKKSNHARSTQTTKQDSQNNQEGEGIKEVLQEKIPQFLSSPVGREITRSVKDFTSSVATGTPITKAIRQTGRRAVKNLIGIGRKRGEKKSGDIVQLQSPEKRKVMKKDVKQRKIIHRRRSIYFSPLS